jgi:hypothetical protein
MVPVVVRDKGDLVPEFVEQFEEFVEAAVDVADDVERTVVVAAVDPQGLASDRRGVDLLGRRKDVDVAESLAVQIAQGLAECFGLAVDDVRAKVSVRRTRLRSRQMRTGRLRTIVTGNTWYSRARRTSGTRASRLDVGGVDHREATALESFGGEVEEDVEGVSGRFLAVLVVGDETAAGIRGDDFGRQEVLAGQRSICPIRMARSGGRRRGWGWRVVLPMLSRSPLS